MTVDQSTLWLQYLQVLSGSVTLQSGEALQAIYPFAPWDWGGRDATTGTSSYDQFEVLNAVPSVPNQNQASAPSPTQQGFDIAYQNWFNELAVGDLMHDSHYRALQDQLTDANNTSVPGWRCFDNTNGTYQDQVGGGCLLNGQPIQINDWSQVDWSSPNCTNSSETFSSSGYYTSRTFNKSVCHPTYQSQTLTCTNSNAYFKTSDNTNSDFNHFDWNNTTIYPAGTKCSAMNGSTKKKEKIKNKRKKKEQK